MMRCAVSLSHGDLSDSSARLVRPQRPADRHANRAERSGHRMGIARAGDYGYEPLGVYHERTSFLEDSELIFTNHGPIAFVDDAMTPTMLLDWKYFADQQPPVVVD